MAPNLLRERIGRFSHLLSALLVCLCVRGPLPAEEPPPAGGLESLPKTTAQAVALTNPGFEQGAVGWRLDRDGPFRLAASGARTGKACLRFDANVPSRYTPSVRQAITDVRRGVYALRFWLKVRGLKPPTRGAGGVRVSVEYHTADGRRAWPSTAVFSGTFDWRLVERRVLVPAGIKDAAATISVHRYGSPAGGEAFFDDFALERIGEPPVECFLLYPNYRGYLPADGPQRIRVWVRVNDPKPPGPARIAASDLATGREVADAELAAGKREGIVELDGSSWPPGGYAIRAKLGDYAYPPYVVRKIAAEQRRGLGVWFDRHNVLHLRGKPTFPIGFYNTVRRFAVVDDAEIARLNKLAEAPVSFHINYTWWPCAMKDRRRYLSEMHQRGIWYLDTLMPFKPGLLQLAPEQLHIGPDLLGEAYRKLETQEQFDRFLTLLASEMRKLPGHGGWYVMDERPFDMVPAIFHQCTVLRRADADHPVYGVSDKPDELFLWRDTLDVFGLDPYPLMNMKAGRPLSFVGQWTRAGVEATHASRPVWMVIQFFQGWSTDRWPTEEELRTMSLMAIAEGARGLFYWSFGARALLWVKDPKQREAYWQRALRVTRELESLTPALVAPDAPDIVAAVSEPRVRWRARQAGGKWYVFAYLPAAKFSERFEGGAVKVTFTLKDGQSVRKELRPDTADWFAVTPRTP